ncbi:nucleotidyltransferase family protein [Caulobacter sp.]|uniref:nucleotidyltransferase family protein n=1 Tax=Caulobacter sp. TaxID=78 RepID=UPI002B4A3189|nr:nucleotidyltransferase family protein [Caulobacter sp.]HJV42625.1 nucleotidyltransferase family protein [Caulobacter sp.]
MTQRNTQALEAVVLAAGRGARFGGDKLLATLDGAPLVTGALNTAFAAPVRRVFVAVGEDEPLRAAVRAGAARLGATERLILVPVADAAEGMGASLRAAAAALPQDTAGVFVFLGDMPAIAATTPALLAASLARPDQIVVPVLAGRRGHPVLFGADWLADLRALGGDEGARALLKRAGPRLVEISVEDRGVHLDIDRPEDLARAAERP